MTALLRAYFSSQEMGLGLPLVLSHQSKLGSVILPLHCLYSIGLWAISYIMVPLQNFGATLLQLLP